MPFSRLAPPGCARELAEQFAHGCVELYVAARLYLAEGRMAGMSLRGLYPANGQRKVSKPA